MSPYTYPQPVCSPYDKKHYILIEDYKFNHCGAEFVIKKGFIWNGSSIPRIFWMTTGTPFDPTHLAASLIHDWFYVNHLVTRVMADKKYEAMIKEHGQSNYNSWKEYKAVRIFGGKAWKNV